MMRVSRWSRLAAVLLVAVAVAAGPPLVELASTAAPEAASVALASVALDDNDNDNDNEEDERKNGPDLKLDYLGWDPLRSGIITFKVTNVGDAPSAATTGRGETLSPPPTQETAPPVPALAPKASFEILYLVFPAEDCENHRVRMSVPLANDRKPRDNTLEVQLCNKDEGVDLKLDYLGMDPGNAQLIKFRVTNVGVLPSEATTGRVETLGPPPAQETAPPIPALAPGGSVDFPYALFGTTGCDNHTVKASVPQAKDRYPINNTRQFQVCGPKPPPPEPDPIVVGPAPRVIPIPEHRRPGRHNLRIDPSYITSYFMDVFLESGSCGPYPAYYGRPGFHPVGWFQREDNREVLGIKFRECAYVGEGQTAVTFDYSLLDEIPDKEIITARLVYRERELDWRGNGGQNGCVTTLDLPTVDWTLPNVSYVPIPTRPYQSGLDNQPLWTVTESVAQQVNNEQPRHGFVLRGALSLYQLEGEGSSSCLSVLDDLHLSVTYEVPD